MKVPGGRLVKAIASHAVKGGKKRRQKKYYKNLITLKGNRGAVRKGNRWENR